MGNCLHPLANCETLKTLQSKRVSFSVTSDSVMSESRPLMMTFRVRLEGSEKV